MQAVQHKVIHVSLKSLLHNLAEIRGHVPAKQVMAIVKKDAYGHGLLPIATALADEVDAFGVIYPDEGGLLRAGGIGKPILVMGATLPEDVRPCIDQDLTFALLSPEQLAWTVEAARGMRRKAKVHIKIDTGLGRLGAPWYSCRELVHAAAIAPEVEVLGVFSHLADADVAGSPRSEVQVRQLEMAIRHFEGTGMPAPLRHLAASGGILHYPATHYDMVRPGHLLYGVYPAARSDRLLHLKPVLSLHSKVVFSKRIRKGDHVGYGARWQAQRDSCVATIPVGYGDGYPRSLTNRTRVLIGGVCHPVAGSVYMDQFVVDTGERLYPPGEPAMLIGQQGSARITADDLAEWNDTVPDDILAAFRSTIPRIYSEQ